MLKKRQAVQAVIVFLFVAPVLALLVSGLAEHYWLSSFARLKFESLENSTIDYRNIYFRRAPANPNLVFLAIDTASVYVDASDPDTIAASRPLSLMLANGYPYPREVYADIFDRLLGAGAKVVALDILFQKPSSSDAALHDALEKYRNQVVIGINFSEDFEAAETSSSASLALPPPSILPSQDPFDDLLGYVNYWQDTDSIVRQAQYRTNADYVSRHIGAEGKPKLYSLAARVVQKAGYDNLVPDDLKGRPIRFANLPKFSTFPLYQIFEPHIWADTFQNGAYFKDKIVVVGPKGDWAKDQILTPYGQMNGAELHLNAINALLQGDFLQPVSNFMLIGLITGSGLLALALALTIASIGWRFLAGLTVVGIYMGSLVWAYDSPGWLLPAVAPLTVFCGSLGTGFVYDFVLTQIEKLRLRTTFERYYSKNVVRYLLDHTEAYEKMLAGTRRPVTVLFSDIRGFTSIVETTADSQQLVDKLNEYFTAMVDCVSRFDGSLDKFMGDGIMAVWGNTPYTFGPDGDAVRAVRSALAMVEELRRLNAKWRSEGKTEWQIGIGLNHGQVIAGDMGSQQQKNYGVIGDAINLGSRLEGLTKVYHLQIILGERVAELVRDKFQLRSVDIVQVKGKSQSVQAFTVLGEKSDAMAPEQRKFLALYEEGVSAFRLRLFPRAQELFEQALQIQPDDHLARDYLASALAFMKSPPDAGWTGIRVMTEK